MAQVIFQGNVLNRRQWVWNGIIHQS